LAASKITLCKIKTIFISISAGREVLSAKMGTLIVLLLLKFIAGAMTLDLILKNKVKRGYMCSWKKIDNLDGCSN
jgi:hypothetical protein